MSRRSFWTVALAISNRIAGQKETSRAKMAVRVTLEKPGYNDNEDRSHRVGWRDL
jgi:hypothetical protein